MTLVHRNLLVLLLAGALLASFSPAFRAGFVYDDHRLLLANPFLDAPLDWSALFLDRHASTPDKNPDIYRPLATLFFFVERKTGGGGPVLHHAVGVFLHMANTLLVLVLLMRLLAATKANDRNPVWPAYVGAGIFALHPLQVESVAWISSRSGQLAACFTLLALAAALRYQRPSVSYDGKGFSRPIIVAGLVFLACLSKESGAMAGVFMLLAVLCIPSFRHRGLVRCCAASFLAALAYVLLRQHVMEGALHQVSPHGGDRLSNLYYGAFGCFYQIGLVFRPHFSNLDYQDGFFDATPFFLVQAGAVAYLAIAASSLFLIRSHRLPAFGILWLAAAQFPASSMAVTMRSLVNDRQMYLPLVGLAVIVTGFLAGLDGRFTPGLRKGAVVLIILLLFVLAGLTFDRCLDWKKSRSLYEAALKTHPRSIKARAGLSKAFREDGELDLSLKTAMEGFGLGCPGTAARMNCLYQAAVTLCSQNRFEEGADLLRQLLKKAENPGRSEDFRLAEKASLELWFAAMFRLRDYERALFAAEKLILHGGESGRHLAILGKTLLSAGRHEEAESVLLRAVALESGEAAIHEYLADLYEETGRPMMAQKERDTARSLEEAKTQPIEKRP